MEKEDKINEIENISGNNINSEDNEIQNKTGKVSDKKENEANQDNLSPQEVTELKLKLEQKEKEASEYVDLLQRTMAEFDNYKKRTAKEKDVLYNNAIIDIMSNVLPVIDNMEKALESCKNEEQGNILEGLQMILKQFKDLLKTYSVYEIEAVGEKFDPEYHEAVVHVNDTEFGENEIIEEFRKGYKMGEKVIRYSMVKVAN